MNVLNVMSLANIKACLKLCETVPHFLAAILAVPTEALYSVKPLSIFLEFKSHHCVTAWVNDSFTLVLD